MEKVTEHFSEKIVWISYWMSVLVLYIHANNLTNVGLADTRNSFDYTVTKLVGGALGEIAVPFFFMISGYWFFRFEIKEKNANTLVLNKLKKRIRTLFIPYLIWNTFGYSFYAVITRVSAIQSMMNSQEVIEINAVSILEGIFLHSCYFPFWYLQELLIIMLFSPIFLYLLRSKKLSELTLVLLAVCSLMEYYLVIFKASSLFFFLLGAYISVYQRRKFENEAEERIKYVALIMILLRIIIYPFDITIVNRLTLLVAPLCICAVADLGTSYRLTWFRRQTFFIYAAHVIPITIVMKILAKISFNDISATIAYILTPVIVLLLLDAAARILNRICPKTYSLICGSR